MRYSRAPIAEAVIDIQTSFKSPPVLSDLESLSGELSERFPLSQPINSFAVKFGSDGSGAPFASNASAAQLGIMRSTERNDRMVHLRLQGLAYSHMPSYTDWDTFCGEMWPIWTRYQEVLSVTQVSRVAVRYINRIAIPDLVDIDDYLNLSPRIPETVSKHITGYFLQVVLPQPDLGDGYRAIVNSGVEPGGHSKAASLLLDIDVFVEGSFSVAGDDVRQVLDRLRDRKNAIFEGSITNAVREIIK